MTKPLSIVVIGAGAHSVQYHLPALQHYAATHAGVIELAGVCDRNEMRALEAAAQFGFAGAFSAWPAMLDCVRPDAVIAVTPAAITAKVACAVMQRGIPLLMEKPLGATRDEARAVVRAAQRASAPVMVSMNRRFDPALRAGLAWRAGRPLTFVRATFAREQRDEPDFIEYTAIHVVDAVLSLLGSVTRATIVTQQRADAVWYYLHLFTAAGACALIEIMPTARCNAEAYELIGPDYRIEARSGWFDTGALRLYEHNRLMRDEQIDPALPVWVRNGTFDETAAFIAALRTGVPPAPTPADVLRAAELCHAAYTAGCAGDNHIVELT